jgi:hypothetical protein
MSIDHSLLPSVSNATLPTTYINACNAMAECSTMDECQTWADKAAALASYAKQSQDEQLMKMAVRIQARAISRCGELLKQIDIVRGDKSLFVDADGSGSIVTRKSAAEQAGLSERQQYTALRVAGVPKDEFERLVESDNPPTITKLAELGKKTRPIVDLQGRDPKAYNRAMHFCGMLRFYLDDLKKYEVSAIIEDLDDKERAKVREYITQIDSIHDQIVTRI